MGSSGFEKLVAYQRARELGFAVYAAVATWESFDRWSTGMQVVRSVDSIAANIAEAVGRRHRLDRRRLYVIARGSLYETEHWLAVARERGLEVPDLSTQELGRTLNGLIDSPVPS